MNKHRGSDFNQFLIEQGLTNTDQPMTPTPTPHTDAAEILWNDTGWCVVPAEFARDLERELAVWKHDVKLLEAELQKFDQAAIEWWCEYQDLKAKARES